MGLTYRINVKELDVRRAESQAPVPASDPKPQIRIADLDQVKELDPKVQKLITRIAEFGPTALLPFIFLDLMDMIAGLIRRIVD